MITIQYKSIRGCDLWRSRLMTKAMDRPVMVILTINHTNTKSNAKINANTNKNANANTDRSATISTYPMKEIDN